MKNSILSIAFICMIPFLSTAQKEEKKGKSEGGSKHAKIFYKPASLETADLKIQVDDAVATETKNKLKLKLSNRSHDYVLFKPEESSMKCEGGEFKYKDRWMILSPDNDNGSRIMDIAGDHRTEKFSLVLNGIYKIPTTTPGIVTPDFNLPASVNDFTTGPFKITMVKCVRLTKESVIDFKVEYVGDKAGILTPSRIGMKMPDGNEYACYKPERPRILQKGGSETITLKFKDIPHTAGDMQKVPMKILWRDAFKEATPEKLPPQTIELVMDEGKTK